MSKNRRRVSNREAKVQRLREQLHQHDHAETRKWNQPDQNQPRQKPPGTGKSSRSSRRRRKAERAAELRRERAAELRRRTPDSGGPPVEDGIQGQEQQAEQAEGDGIEMPKGRP